MSETTSVWESTTQPPTASSAPIASTSTGRRSETPVTRRPIAPRRRPSAAAGRANGRASERRQVARRRAPTPPRRPDPGAATARPAPPSPPTARRRTPARTPPISTRPKPRTIGTGDSSSTAKPGHGGQHRRPDRRQRQPHRAVEAVLLQPRLVLDRVVDAEAEQHGQDGDRGQRQPRAEQRHQPEHGAGRAERDRQRQHPVAPPAEDERQHQRHHQQAADQQADQRVRQRPGDVVDDDHGRARDQVRRAVGRASTAASPPRRGQRDRVRALGVGQAAASGARRSAPSAGWGTGRRSAPWAGRRRAWSRRPASR